MTVKPSLPSKSVQASAWAVCPPSAATRARLQIRPAAVERSTTSTVLLAPGSKVPMAHCTKSGPKAGTVGFIKTPPLFARSKVIWTGHGHSHLVFGYHDLMLDRIAHSAGRGCARLISKRPGGGGRHLVIHHP